MSKKPENLALEKAKIQLMMMPNTVFITTILFSLVQEWKDDIETAQTNGTFLYINPKWFLSLDEKERVGLLAHEVNHVAFSHMTRRGPRDPGIWNGAGDQVINLELTGAGYTIPKGGLCDRQYQNMNTELVYDKLFEEAEQNPGGMFGANGSGVPGGQDISYPEDSKTLEATKKAIADTVLRAVVQSQAANEDPGTIAGEINIQLQSVINPKLPWNVILQNHMQSILKDDFSWRRPNKRFMPDYYLPTAFSEAICNIAVAVDSSGSVMPDEFSFFIVEIATIQELMKPELITLIDFDTKIRSIQEITEGTDCFRDLKFTGGGGTDVLDMLKWAKKNKPDVLLVFTDGEFHMPNKKHYPSCPTIWLIHDDPRWKSDFGEVVHYDIF